MDLYPNANWLSDHAMVVSKVVTHEHGEITVASWNMAGTADNWLEFNCSQHMEAFNDYSKEALMALRGHSDLDEFQDSLTGGVGERGVKGDAHWGPYVKKIHPGEMESVAAALVILEQGPKMVQTINNRIIKEAVEAVEAVPAGGGAAAAGSKIDKIDRTGWLKLYSQYAIVLAYLLNPDEGNFPEIAEVVRVKTIDLGEAQTQFKAQQDSTPANREEHLASTLRHALVTHDIDFACIQEALPDERMFGLDAEKYAIVYRRNANFGPNRETAIVYNKKWRTYPPATVEPHVEWADGTSSGEIMKQMFKRLAYVGDPAPFCVGNAHLTSTGDVETKAIQTKGGISVDQYEQACVLLAGCGVVGIDSNFKGQFKTGSIPFGGGTGDSSKGKDAAASQAKLAGDIFIGYTGSVKKGTVMKQRGYFQSQLNKTEPDSAGKDLVMVHRDFGTEVKTHLPLNRQDTLESEYNAWLLRGEYNAWPLRARGAVRPPVAPTLRPHDRLWSFAER